MNVTVSMVMGYVLRDLAVFSPVFALICLLWYRRFESAVRRTPYYAHQEPVYEIRSAGFSRLSRKNTWNGWEDGTLVALYTLTALQNDFSSYPDAIWWIKPLNYVIYGGLWLLLLNLFYRRYGVIQEGGRWFLRRRGDQVWSKSGHEEMVRIENFGPAVRVESR